MKKGRAGGENREEKKLDDRYLVCSTPTTRGGDGMFFSNKEGGGGMFTPNNEGEGGMFGPKNGRKKAS